MITGDRVRYRSLAGDVYDAVIVRVHDDDTADLDVDVPGTEVRVLLRAAWDGVVWSKEGIR